MDIRESVLKLTGLSGSEDTAQIDTIIAVVSERLIGKLTILTGETVDAVPDALAAVVVEIVLARYNRIGSEGTSSHNVDGEAMAWSVEDDFKPYKAEIEDYADSVRKVPGRLRFL